MDENIRRLRDRLGPGFVVVRRILAARGDGSTVSEIVSRTGVSRRTVQMVLRELGDDAVTLPDRTPSEPIPTAPELPRRKDLDQVHATEKTRGARAQFLSETFELSGSHVVFLGDDDLTSLAVHAVAPDADKTVVDVDDGVLQAVDEAGVRARYADLRLGLPRSIRETADIVFCDPPYTPVGIELFLRHGIEALRDRETGRIVCCHGTGETQPMLAYKVQSVMHRLGLAVEAMLPKFNAYDGAEAIGSRSDLYVLRATTRTPSDTRLGADARIFSHGKESVESTPAEAPRPPDGFDATIGYAASPSLADYLHNVSTKGKPPFKLPFAGRVSVWLGAYPHVLAQVLLSANATELHIPSGKLDQALRKLLAPRWTISTRDGALAAKRRKDTEEPVLRWILDHPRALVASSWREALTKHAGLTKNQARERIPSGWDAYLDELPSFRLRAMPAAVEETVQQPSA